MRPARCGRTRTPGPKGKDGPERSIASLRQSRLRPFGARWEDISAGTILVIAPTLVVFLFLQRYIYNGFARGATK